MTKKITLKIKGIHCQSCVSLIKNNIQALAGIVNVTVDADSQRAEIIYDGNKATESDIIEKIKKAGDYVVEHWNEKDESQGDNPEEAIAITSSSRQGNSSAGSNIFATKNFLKAGIVVSVLLNVIFLTNATSRNVLKNSLAALSQSGNTIKNNQEGTPNENNSLPLVVANEEPQGQTKEVFNITRDDHVRGDFNASITLVEFSDFECPFCERQYQTLKQLLKEYPKEIRLIYKHFPLGFHANAQKAAEASECASEQDSFWEYHDKLFANYQDYSLDNFKQWAKDLDLKAEKFNDCLDSGKYARKVQDDAKEGQQVGVNGTPATFINGRLISGALPYATFKGAIDSLLK